MQTILFDMTPLDTPSRYRGFGRYVRDLALGLSKLSDREKDGLRILGLTQLHWNGDYEITEDLASFVGSAHVPSPGVNEHYRERYKRRVALWRAARRVQADLVHLGDPQATPLGRRWSRSKFLVTCHDLIPFLFPDQYFSYRDGWGLVGRQLERRRYTTADHVVAISDATRKDLIRFLGLSPERITRVYNGIDLDRWRRRLSDGEREQRLAAYGLTGKKFLLYVGDADWRKNVEGMMGGLSKARGRGAEVEMVLAGALSESRAQRVDALAQQHGVSEWVHRVGHLGDDDLVAMFQGAVAHIFVSRAEGFGLPVIESMACGCPVITTRATSLSEVAEHAALLVDPEDHEQIGEAIGSLVRHPELRADIVSRGLERAKVFSNQRQATEMVALYRRLTLADD